MSWVSGLFASEMRRAREEAGLTREQLAEAAAFSVSLIEKVETGQRGPSEQFASVMDDVLKTNGLLSRIRRHALTHDATPEWLRSWFDVEQQATRIMSFELSLVPGLLQTEEYAETLLQGNEAKLAARVERQSILERDITYVALIDQRALRYPVGGPDVMAKQIEYLIGLTDRFVIQIVPADCGTYLHLDGSFSIATVDGREYAYADSPVRGLLLHDPEVLSRTKERWDLIRAEALSRRQTIEFMQEVAEEWNSKG